MTPPDDPPHIPDAYPTAKVVPVARRVSRDEPPRPADLPEVEPPRPKVALALGVALLTLLGIVAALSVLGYAIVTGLKKAAKKPDPVPVATQLATPTTKTTGKTK